MRDHVSSLAHSYHGLTFHSVTNSNKHADEWVLVCQGGSSIRYMHIYMHANKYIASKNEDTFGTELTSAAASPKILSVDVCPWHYL